MLTNIVCWTIWVNAFAHLTASFFMYTFIGRFHFHVLKFSGETAGLMAALPSAPYIPLRICMGYINDKITCVRLQYYYYRNTATVYLLPFFKLFCR